MTKNYNATGEARKQMVQAISAELGIQPIYTRMPECAFLIGDIKVTKAGELVWDERTNEETIARAIQALSAVGFTGQDPAPEDTDGASAEATAGDSSEVPPIDSLTFSFPRADFTEMALANLKALVASKQTLIKKALQADSLEIEVDDEKVSFPWWGRVGTPEETTAYGQFLSALVKMAKEAKRVTAKEHPTESEKYTFRTFLLRLGFIGADHKKTRAILMEHLSGHAAFKNQADADAFYERLKAKKAAEKEAAAEADNADSEGEEATDEISE